MNVLAISGSLRAQSLNTALLRALGPLAPEGMEIDIVTLEGIPLYSEELDLQRPHNGADQSASPPVPSAVAELRRRVHDADGVIISTPEYNRSISGVLKNALDWLSRPAFRGAIYGKTVLALVATESAYHGLNAHVALTTLLRHLTAFVLEPDFVLRRADELLVSTDDGEVQLLNAFHADFLRLLLEGLADAIRKDAGRLQQDLEMRTAEALLIPRRQAKEYPLSIRSMSSAEVAALRKTEAWA